MDTEDQARAVRSAVDLLNEKEPLYASSEMDDTFPSEFDDEEILRIENRLEALQQLTQSDGKLVVQASAHDPTDHHDEVDLQHNVPVEAAMSAHEEQQEPTVSQSQDITPPSSQSHRKSMQIQRSYLPRSSILLSTTLKGTVHANNRIGDDLKKLHPVQQAYDVFHRRTNMYTSYRRQGSRLPLFTAAVGPKERLPSALPVDVKPLKRVKSLMVTSLKEEHTTVKVRRAFSVANIKEKDSPAGERTKIQTTARTQIQTTTRTQKRVSQPAANVRNSTIIEPTRTSRKKADSTHAPSLEKPMRKAQPKIEPKVAKPPVSAAYKDDAESRKTQPRRNGTVNKLLKQEASLRFDRRARIKA
jgi:hypothetical protein